VWLITVLSVAPLSPANLHGVFCLFVLVGFPGSLSLLCLLHSLFSLLVWVRSYITKLNDLAVLYFVQDGVGHRCGQDICDQFISFYLTIKFKVLYIILYMLYYENFFKKLIIIIIIIYTDYTDLWYSHLVPILYCILILFNRYIFGYIKLPLTLF